MHEKWHGIAATVHAARVYDPMGGRGNHIVGHACQHVARIDDEVMRLARNRQPTPVAIEHLKSRSFRGYEQSNEVDVFMRRGTQTALRDVG